MREIEYWTLSPVYKPTIEELLAEGMMVQTAALQQCLATGETLATMGGGGYALSTKVVDALDMNKHGGQPRVVVDAADFDALVALAQKLAETNEGLAVDAQVILERLR